MTITAATSPTVFTPAKTRPALWLPALAAGVAAAAATTAMAAVLRGVGISLAVGGEPIPLAGFANLTLMCVAIGYILAVALRRFARSPQRTFVVATLSLTMLSFIPDLVVAASLGTRVCLITMHTVAAAVVIPAIASRLSNQQQ